MGQPAGKRFEINYHPADQHRAGEVDMRDEARQRVQQPVQQCTLQCDQHPEIHAPDDEIPARAMPESGQQPDQQQVGQGPLPPAPQRNVHIIAQKSADRHVPSGPKLRRRTRDVGIVEIFPQGKAEHGRKSDRHVRITREVEVDLQPEQDGPQPGSQHRQVGWAAVHYDRHQLGEGIGQHELLGQTGRKPVYAAAEAFDRHAGRFNCPLMSA